MNSKWIETYAHLNRYFTYDALDKFADDCDFQMVWLHAPENKRLCSPHG